MWKDKKLRWLIAASLFIGTLEILSLLGWRIPDPYAFFFYLTLIIVIGHQALLNGVKALFHLNFKSINLLMVLAIIGAFYLGEYVEAAVVIILFTLAEHLEDVGIATSKSAFDRLLEEMPRTILVKGESVPRPIEQAQLGMILLVKPGQMIPLDGKVVSGASFVDESTITGEPVPKDKREGDAVYAGTLNKQGVLEIEVVKLAGETTMAKIREMTFNATKNKAETQKFIEKFSQVYTPFIMALAFLWVGVPTLMGMPFKPFLSDALNLLVIACPCALVISTPISIYSALGNASAKGVLIKGGRYVEALGQIDVMALDKTRTLTYGKPKVSAIIPFGKTSKETLLSCAAGMEKLSEHPLAESIVEAAKEENYTPHNVENFESIIGKGAKADCMVCEEGHHCIGKLQFILEEHKVPNEVIQMVEEIQNKGQTAVVVSSHHEVKGIIAIEDALRPESKELVSELKRLNVLPMMLSGDNPVAARAIAEKVGIESYKGGLLPQDKAYVVQELIDQGKSVGMVGDGINDAPALALATVGVSMASIGSDTALEASSIVILNDHLNLIPDLIKLGRRTLRMIKFNTAFAVAVKFVFIVLALLGLSSLPLAIFADVGVTILVILNSLRLR